MRRLMKASLQLNSIFLGSQTLRTAVALAPMAGWTDVPFRTLAWRYGAGHMVSEMVSDKLELWETGKSRLRRVPVPGVSPIAVQIAGTDPQELAIAAQRHVADGVDVIDINFGCPAKKVCRKLAGSALLANPELVSEIVSAVVQAVPVPVTVKTRTGLEPKDGLGVEIAQRVAAAGAQMLTVHARSRACRFVGPVDYAAVAAMKAAVDIPVIVNGDIADISSAQNALKLSGADGVMVGRAAMGKPWVFASLTGASVPTGPEKVECVAEHLRLMYDFYGEETGVRMARKHLQAYAQNGVLPDVGEIIRAPAAIDQLRWVERMVRAAAQAA